MVGYAVLEQAIISKFLSSFSDMLDANTVKGGDIDAVIDSMLEGDKTYGVVMECAGGRNDQNSFSKPMWKWYVDGAFMIRYRGDGFDIEGEMRNILFRLAQLFVGDEKLGGLTPLVRMDTINMAEPVTVDDLPMYWLPFRIDIYDRY